MAIRGRRDGEPSAEEAHESQAGARGAQEPPAQAPPAQEPAGEHHAEEAAPAFWRAQGQAVHEAPAGEPVMVEAKELAGARAQGSAAAEVQEPAVTAARADTHDPGISAQRWREILVAFVDDPRGSVKMAADAVDEAIDEFVNSVRARQRTLSSSWQGPEAGTEQFRTAVRDYRTLWHQVRQLDLGEKKTGG